jgi:hypothetical protein
MGAAIGYVWIALVTTGAPTIVTVVCLLIPAAMVAEACIICQVLQGAI